MSDTAAGAAWRSPTPDPWLACPCAGCVADRAAASRCDAPPEARSAWAQMRHDALSMYGLNWPAADRVGRSEWGDEA